MKSIQRLVLSVLVFILTCIAVGICSFVWLGLRMRDKEPNPNTPIGRQKLQIIAQSAQPLLTALKSYRHDHNHYPTSLTLLYPHYISEQIHAPNYGWKGWYYYVDPTNSSPQEYSLSFSIDIDSTFNYRHQKSGSQWIYDPGTGAAEIILPYPKSD